MKPVTCSTNAKPGMRDFQPDHVDSEVILNSAQLMGPDDRTD